MCLSQALNFSVSPEHSLISNNKNSYALCSSGQFLDDLSFRLLAIRACSQCEQCTKRHTEPCPWSVRTHWAISDNTDLRVPCCWLSNLKHLDSSPLPLQTKTGKANCTGLYSLIHHSNIWCSLRTQLSVYSVFLSSLIWHKLYWLAAIYHLFLLSININVC